MPMANEIAAAFVFIFVTPQIFADVYLHNPRGSNNRLNENTRERQQANRLFDSQNNNRGGYNVGSMYYYQGSKLPIEWTNQHSCSNPKSHCEIVIQYMCGDLVRDGVTTKQIPLNQEQCANGDCNTDKEYGMHEDYDYYRTCQLRQRNKGLFIADQRVGIRAVNTRQNRNGNRNGYECPEERDYYPYWHPTPWKDIAVLTNDASRCNYYQQESENVKERWYCEIPTEALAKNTEIPNNKEDCEKFRWPLKSPDGTRAEWKQSPSHNIAAPVCRETEFTRDNHLGNTLGGYPPLFNWTVPHDVEHESCTIRIRYNVSTADYDPWMSDAEYNAKKVRDGSQVNLGTKYGLSSTESAARGYTFKNNPEVQVFKSLEGFKLELAVNTAQFGRTFQDRSHTVAIRKRPASLNGATIHNVNVRGKRGNIVQVYPSVEYDFVPNTLEIGDDEYIHFQWTGSNNNNANNDGQGRAGTDRSNVVIQAMMTYDEGNGDPNNKYGHWGRSYPDVISTNTTFLGLSQQDLMTLAYTNQFRGDVTELDDAGTYFDLGPRKVTKKGTYHYLSTRNNNFSNRSQKGRIIILPYRREYQSIGWNGGEMSLREGKTSVTVPQGTFSSLVKMQLDEWSSEYGDQQIKSMGRSEPDGSGYASNFLIIHPEDKITHGDSKMQVNMDITSNDVQIYRSNSNNFATWEQIPAEIKDGVAAFSIDQGGVYVARQNSKVALIVGLTIALVAIMIIIIGTVIYFRRYPSKWQLLKAKTRKAKRSMQPVV